MFLAVLCHPRDLYDFKIIWDFRKIREKNLFFSETGIKERQYLWGAKVSGVPVERVKTVIRKWMFEKPLRHLSACRFEGTAELFDYLKENKIRIGIFSDYPVIQKLDVLRLAADEIVCALDEDVDRLKPDPKGLYVAAEKLGVSVRDCLFIGDRDNKDGECARRAGMPFMILDRKQNFYQSRKTYDRIDSWINK
jgi:phosphoglycolate phosphatase/putative hydrolase of the HAD superfamily